MTMTDPAAPIPAPDAAVGVAAGALVIEPMRRRHLRQVLRIEARTSTTPWSLGLFVAELGRGDERAYLVARRGSRVVGYAGALLVAGEAHVTTIAVDPDQQGGGLGRALLLALVRRCVVLGTGAVTLEVRASNEPAKALYRRFGFAPAGVRKGYYSKPTEDALVLWAHEVDQPDYAERLAAIDAALPEPVVLDPALAPAAVPTPSPAGVPVAPPAGPSGSVPPEAPRP